MERVCSGTRGCSGQWVWGGHGRTHSGARERPWMSLVTPWGLPCEVRARVGWTRHPMRTQRCLQPPAPGKCLRRSYLQNPESVTTPSPAGQRWPPREERGPSAGEACGVLTTLSSSPPRSSVTATQGTAGASRPPGGPSAAPPWPTRRPGARVGLVPFAADPAADRGGWPSWPCDLCARVTQKEFGGGGLGSSRGARLSLGKA